MLYIIILLLIAHKKNTHIHRERVLENIQILIPSSLSMFFYFSLEGKNIEFYGNHIKQNIDSSLHHKLERKKKSHASHQIL